MANPRLYPIELPAPWQPPAGRRRVGTRFGIVGIAAVIAALLTTFGIGVAVLSPVFAGDPPAKAPAAAASPSASELPLAVDTPPSEPPATASARPSPSTPRATGNAGLEDEVLRLINEERQDNRCRAVKMDEKLRQAARAHSTDMAARNFFSHTGSDGSSFVDRARRAGYNAAMSENIAKGYRSAEAVVRGWMNSPGHRRNILNCDARSMGVGVAVRNNEPFWTQDFGRA